MSRSHGLHTIVPLASGRVQVRHGMVRVVFVLPPCDAEALEDVAEKVPHGVTEHSVGEHLYQTERPSPQDYSP